MASTTSDAGETPEQAMSFDPVLRRGKIAQWRQTLQATDYRVMGPALCISADGVILSPEQRAALWRLHKHPSGIRVLHKWNTLRLPVEELAGYHGMHEHALVNFTDTVVCDIIREGLLFIAMRFDLNVKPLLPHDINNILPELPPDMSTLYTDILSKWNVSAPPRRLINPIELVLAYTRNPPLKSLIDTIASSLSVPTFLPITRNMIYQRDNERDMINPEATTLAHAIQILLFAPTQWNPDIIYKRDSSQYTHRYPTPAGHGGNIRTVAGKFSLEDLHRSILLLYLTIARRTSGIMDFGRPPLELGEFLGYFDVPRREPIPDDISTYIYP
ncbi:uncharacterized protein TrAtP1_009338 [Trichoderma atroviride]|uniref:uncharacterized protein n=1 Tax=Hypocrea atroviridis TaxID=63577 RepID=UPI00331F50E6|nr:hypothetical protein TrAtP1_009338 [Trichoderma atroviride]